MNPFIAEWLATERIEDLKREAQRERLAAQARAPRPLGLRRVWGRLPRPARWIRVQLARAAA